MKIMTVVGTRPELIKLSAVIQLIDQHLEQILVHTGQNYDYELHEIFYQDLNIRKPNYFLNAADDTPSKSVANVILGVDQLLIQEKPDAFLLLGDTNSCLSAYAAKRHQIPIFHMEAGNRCFDMRVPEEINRKLVDHMSDINLVYTEHARRYLLAEGIPGEQIIKTGSPLQEIYARHMDKIQHSNVLKQLDILPNKYFVISLHREENLDYLENIHKLLNAFKAIYKKYQLPLIFSTHPRTRKKIESLQFDFSESNITFMPPFNFSDYVHLQMNAFCVISDSGSITEESSLLNFPAVTIRQAHERPEGMDEGTLIMTGLNTENILTSIEVVTQHHQHPRLLKKVFDYDTETVSHKVLRAILSYTDYVNKVTWRKKDTSR